MTYQVLAQSFPHVISTTPDHVERLVHLLLDPRRADVPLVSDGSRSHGSSFAVTVNGTKDRWNLWLSEVSYAYLQAEGTS